MAKPHIHADSSVKKFGGKPEDYLEIHEFLDSSKVALGDVRHRMLTHNTWFINVVIPRVFGKTITNSDGTVVSTVLISEHHVVEDFSAFDGKKATGEGFIPAASDWASSLEFQGWMDNGKDGEFPPSALPIRKSAPRKKLSSKADAAPLVPEIIVHMQEEIDELKRRPDPDRKFD